MNNLAQLKTTSEIGMKIDTPASRSMSRATEFSFTSSASPLDCDYNNPRKPTGLLWSEFYHRTHKLLRTECWEQRSLYPWSAADKDEPFSDITGAASVIKPFTFLIVTFLLHIVLTIMLFPTLNDIYDLRTKVIHDLINASKYKAMSNKWKQINEVTGEVTHVYQWNILQAITSTVTMSHLWIRLR